MRQFIDSRNLESLILLTAFMVKYISICIVDFRLQGAADLGVTGAMKLSSSPELLPQSVLLLWWSWLLPD